MYYKNQTLVHSITRKLARLNPNYQHEDSTWAWNISKTTPFIDEDGNEFLDDIKVYGPVYDWLDRPRGDDPHKGCHVATHLRRYVEATPEERAEMKEQYLLDWECDLIGELEEKDHITAPFADGSKSLEFKKFFLERRGARPMYLHYCFYNKEKASDAYSSIIFRFKGNVWAVNARIGSLVKVDKEYLQEQAKVLAKWAE